MAETQLIVAGEETEVMQGLRAASKTGSHSEWDEKLLKYSEHK